MLWIEAEQPGQTGIGARKEMVVDLAFAAAVKISSAEVSARRKRHVTLTATCFRLGRIIEAPRAMTGNGAQKIRIIVVLAS